MVRQKNRRRKALLDALDFETDGGAFFLETDIFKSSRTPGVL
jgi:hypothetical protein